MILGPNEALIGIAGFESGHMSCWPRFHPERHANRIAGLDVLEFTILSVPGEHRIRADVEDGGIERAGNRRI